MGLSIVMSVIRANSHLKETAAEANKKYSIGRFCVNRGRSFPNVILHSRGCVVVKGCFLMAQLEAAFVKS